MCILLQHANHKELLTSPNNGTKTVEIAVTASKRETRCCINICDPICKKGSLTHIQFMNFDNPYFKIG